MKNAADKTRLFVFIVVLIFVLIECNSNQQSANENIDTTSLNNQDSISVSEDDGNIDINEVITKPFSFENNKFEICYVKNEKLYLYDIKTGKKLVLPEDYPVFHMTSSKNGKTIYYTVVTEDSDGLLWLKKAEFSGSTVNISWLADLQEPASKFKTETYSEKANFINIKDTVFLAYNYEWLDGFSKYIKYVLSKKSISFINKSIFTVYSEMNSGNREEFASLYDSIRRTDVNGIQELFLFLDNDSVQLTNTRKIDEEMKARKDDENSVDIKEFSGIKISPDSSNLCFSIETEWGDLAHGPSFIVSMNGQNQQKLNDDIMSKLYQSLWLPDGKNLLFFKEKEIGDETYYLYMTTGNNNKFKLIDEEVDYYIIR